VQAALEAQLNGLVLSLPDLSEETLHGYSLAASARTAGAQTRAGRLAAGFLLALADRRRRRRQPVRLDEALHEVLVTPASPVAYSPVLRARKLEPDLGLPAALAAAGSYAAGLGSGDVQAAQRAGLDAGAAATGEHIIGWRKELDPACCDWCQLVGAERVYRAADSVPFHERDKCSVSPVLAGDEEEE
jgi:hypothetical protein